MNVHDLVPGTLLSLRVDDARGIGVVISRLRESFVTLWASSCGDVGLVTSSYEEIDCLLKAPAGRHFLNVLRSATHVRGEV